MERGKLAQGAVRGQGQAHALALCDTKGAGGDTLRMSAAPRANAGAVCGREYDARRLRSQRDVIRDVMLAADTSGSWLTLRELHRLTQYGEASISAQLRHLRKLSNGGYRLQKRFREDGVWEYRMSLGGIWDSQSPDVSDVPKE